METIWKEIPRYPHCEASNTGLIRYKTLEGRHGKTKKIRPLKLAGFGYYQVSIDGKTESVHNLITETFIGQRPDPSYEADHIDGNKTNNTPGNLRWISHGHNTARSRLTGGRRYFYEGELWLIKGMLSRRIPYKTVGKCFRCSTMLIQDVLKGLKDRHIKASA